MNTSSLFGRRLQGKAAGERGNEGMGRNCKRNRALGYANRGWRSWAVSQGLTAAQGEGVARYLGIPACCRHGHSGLQKPENPVANTQRWRLEVKAMGTDWLSADCRQAGRDSFCYTIQFRNFTAYVLTVWIRFFKLTYPPKCSLRNTVPGKCSVSRVQAWDPKIGGTYSSLVCFSYRLRGGVFQ